MIITKQLKSIPFDKLYQIHEEATQAAIEGLQQQYQQEYEAQVLQLEQQYSETHEAPSEAGFGDQVELKRVNHAEVRRREGNKAITDIWMPRYKLNSLLVDVLPQALAYIAQKPFRLAELVTVEGQIDGAKMLKSAFDFQSTWDRGLYLFLMLDSRSSYLPTQYKGPGVQFCSLVPLIPYAFKLHHKIPYSRWDRATLKWVVNKSLCDAMLHQGTYTREELLKARELGMTYQSGPKKDEQRNPQTNFKLWATKGGCMQGVPHLAQVMYTQIWCAHPSNRTPYMVLDPENWDRMPAPLVAETLFMPTTAKSKSKPSDPGLDDDGLPWQL